MAPLHPAPVAFLDSLQALFKALGFACVFTFHNKRFIFFTLWGQILLWTKRRQVQACGGEKKPTNPELLALSVCNQRLTHVPVPAGWSLPRKL